MARFKLIANSTGHAGVYETENGGLIPFDEDNRHYVEYLEWVAAGNTPDPAS